jgi:hypothetical protein
MKDVNVNITIRSPTPYTFDKPILQKPQPQPSLPKVVQQPKYSTPVPPTSPRLDKNANEQVTPKPPLRPSLSESPP